jgi:hypothetical protein
MFGSFPPATACSIAKAAGRPSNKRAPGALGWSLNALLVAVQGRLLNALSDEP